ncbi:MAG: hypothetical protein ABI474_07570 [Actinomycetota bacterium]
MSAPTISTRADARSDNWRFLLPADVEPLVVCGPADLPRGRLAPRSQPALAVPDLGRLARSSMQTAERLVADLVLLLQPGGWLCVGFDSTTSPASWPHLRTAAGRSGVVHVLQGLQVSITVYAALPGAQCPALLIPTEDGAAFEYALHHVLYPHTRSTSALRGRAEVTALGVARSAALHMPDRIRASLLRTFAPGLIVVGRRGEARP